MAPGPTFTLAAEPIPRGLALGRPSTQLSPLIHCLSCEFHATFIGVTGATFLGCEARFAGSFGGWIVQASLSAESWGGTDTPDLPKSLVQPVPSRGDPTPARASPQH